jgi:hypothetical protein
MSDQILHINIILHILFAYILINLKPFMLIIDSSLSSLDASVRCASLQTAVIPLSQITVRNIHQLRRGSAAARLLGSWVRIPPGAWMFVSCECCVLLSGRGLCEEPIPRPEESYRLWCVSQCDQKELQTSTLKRETGVGRRGRLKKKSILNCDNVWPIF